MANAHEQTAQHDPLALIGEKIENASHSLNHAATNANESAKAAARKRRRRSLIEAEEDLEIEDAPENTPVAKG